MAKYRISETVPCLVTWVCEIEANNEDDARAKFMNGERGGGESEPFIGDAIGDYSLENNPVALQVELLHPAGDLEQWLKPKDKEA